MSTDPKYLRSWLLGLLAFKICSFADTSRKKAEIARNIALRYC